MPVRHLDDAHDPVLDDYRALRTRESRDVLWAEGPTVVERLVASSLTVRSVLLSPAAAERLHDTVTQRVDPGVPVLVAPQRIINEVVGFNLHRGAIAVARRPTFTQLGTLSADARRLVVLEGVNDPENLGAIARSARGLGADGLVLDPTCADPWYRRSVRTSMGELLHLPVARASMLEGLHALARAGWSIWALTPARAAHDIRDLVRDGVPSRLALVAGAEGPGLTDVVLSAYTNVRIPLRDDVDSLNVGHAIAASLLVTSIPLD